MNFKDWMLKYINSDTKRGDLSRDIQADKKFPETNDYHAILEYLENHGACDSAIQTFKNCFKSFIND